MHRTKKPKPPAEWHSPAFYAAKIGGRPETLIGEIRAGRLKATNFAAPGKSRPRYRIREADFDLWLAGRAVVARAPAAPRRRPEVAVRQYV
jgi:hypothetical protein